MERDLLSQPKPTDSGHHYGPSVFLPKAKNQRIKERLTNVSGHAGSSRASYAGPSAPRRRRPSGPYLLGEEGEITSHKCGVVYRVRVWISDR
jgi:hypothetical protein